MSTGKASYTPPHSGKRHTYRFPNAALVGAVFAATAFLPLSADDYQYIITPGYDPAVASTNGCGLAVSASSSFSTGKLPALGIASGETTSRYRTLTASNTSALNARKWRQCYIDFR